MRTAIKRRRKASPAPPDPVRPAFESALEEAPRAKRTWRDLDPAGVRTALMVGAAALVAAAAFLPLWGMTLVSVQYPEGLRMVIYPDHIRGDIAEINLLNHYIGMAEISNDYFQELRVIPGMFAAIAIAALGGALVRRTWATLLPLVLMVATAVYGFWSMRARLYQFGHDLDPAAPIEIEPFTPAMIGSHTIAQFATYAYFSWGTFLPMLAGALICAALWLDLRKGGSAAGTAAVQAGQIAAG